MPDFIALSTDAETQAAAKTLGQVLWDDLAFEREFYMIPRDTYTSIPPSKSIDDVPFDRWRELGADGVVIGTVQRTARASSPDAALTSATRQAAFAQRVHGIGDQSARSTPTPSPTRSTSCSAG